MFRHLCYLLIAVFFMLVKSSPAFSQDIPGIDALNTPCTKCCGYDCADSCSNKPFQPSSCKTSACGPARANIVFGSSALKSTNMLFCPGGTKDKPQPYALCFFSGPNVATGTPGSVDTNNTLVCTPNLEKGVANCQCQVYNQGAFYVDINSILNLGAFWQTHDICGRDGSKCKNIAACDANGNQKTNCGSDPCPVCTDAIAPVCEYVAAQPFNNEDGLYPKSSHASASRVDLISTFSFAMGDTTQNNPYQLGSQACKGLYAGCMTAACSYVDGKKGDGSIVNCACPLWRGDYQIGQPGSDLPASTNCPTELTNLTWVWSAANNVHNQASCK